MNTHTHTHHILCKYTPTHTPAPTSRYRNYLGVMLLALPLKLVRMFSDQLLQVVDIIVVNWRRRRKSRQRLQGLRLWQKKRRSSPRLTFENVTCVAFFLYLSGTVADNVYYATFSKVTATFSKVKVTFSKVKVTISKNILIVTLHGKSTRA